MPVEWKIFIFIIVCYGGAYYISGAILKVFFAICKKLYNSLE